MSASSSFHDARPVFCAGFRRFRHQISLNQFAPLALSQFNRGAECVVTARARSWTIVVQISLFTCPAAASQTATLWLNLQGLLSKQDSLGVWVACPLHLLGPPWLTHCENPPEWDHLGLQAIHYHVSCLEPKDADDDDSFTPLWRVLYRMDGST